MKKYCFVLFLMMFICGCDNDNGNELDNYEHYDLRNQYNLITYSYVDENNHTHLYKIADITPEKSEEIINGLFYKISNDDYILIDKIKSCNSSSEYKIKKYNYFYNNKLYVNRCSGGVVLEYTLSGINIEKKNLLSKFDSKLMLSSIEKVDDDYVYYTGYESISGPIHTTRCSIKNYKCELVEK